MKKFRIGFLLVLFLGILFFPGTTAHTECYPSGCDHYSWEACEDICSYYEQGECFYTYRITNGWCCGGMYSPDCCAVYNLYCLPEGGGLVRWRWTCEDGYDPMCQ